MTLRVAVRLPNHLGDTVMAWPALEALAARHAVTVYGPPLLRPFWPRGPWSPPGPMPRRQHDAAVLFASSWRAAWEARRVPRRIGTPTDHRRVLLTEAVAPRTHRSATYAALAAQLGAVAEGPPRLTPSRPCGPPHIGLNPIVKGGPTRAWTGFRALADALSAIAPVVFYAGPGEAKQLAAVAGPHRQVAGRSLPDFAGRLGACRVFVSNDAGSAHFARALGTPTVVVYGSTVPERTGPAGAVAVRGPTLACTPCYRNRCRWGETPVPCLDVPVDHVRAEVEALWGP
ncbi:MAG: glycosyltransferase family 9 protein [Myxococcota bacterium]